MAKRKEIREGIKQQIEYIKLSTMEIDWHIDQLLSYLDKNDVVRKVERKLPRCGHMAVSAVHGNTNPVCPLAKAGCGFFEPLIKEV